MDGVKKYNYIHEGKKIIIKVGKKSNNLGETIYFARTNYENIISLAECEESALENCVKKIKFSTALLERKIKLLKEEVAVGFAKAFFEDNFSNRELICSHKNNLSYSIFVKDDILTLNVTISNVKLINTIAIIYVNLVTGECDMVESCFIED
jgi:hypothetical protein